MRQLLRRVHKLASLRSEFFRDVLESAAEKLKPHLEKKTPSAEPEKKAPADEVPAPTTSSE